MDQLFECVVNVSEGRDPAILATLDESCELVLIDRHDDPDHNRSVFTLASDNPSDLLSNLKSLSEVALKELTLDKHVGVHPRFGVVDVVPFVTLDWDEDSKLRDSSDISTAIKMREEFSNWLESTHHVTTHSYGLSDEPSLPEVREMLSRAGQPSGHGSTCVGLRSTLVAYNIFLSPKQTIEDAKKVVSAIRSPFVRALAFETSGAPQVSCNLISPWRVGPAELVDQVSSMAEIWRCELVGLIPASIVDAIPTDRHQMLDLVDKTIEGVFNDLSTR